MYGNSSKTEKLSDRAKTKTGTKAFKRAKTNGTKTTGKNTEKL